MRLVGPLSPNLWRNNAGCSYPYNIGNVISIKYSSASTNPTGYYYYFYNWEIKEPDCISPKVPVNIQVSDLTLSTSFTDETAPNMNDGTASVTATGNGPFTYFWNTGATTSTVSGLSGGIYYVTVTDFFGCTKVDSVVIGTLNYVAFEGTEKPSVYPNPVNSCLYISYTNMEETIIELFDLSGKLVPTISERTNANLIKLDIRDFPKGVYIIKMSNNSGTNYYRFIKQ